jgi:hypothetical protein
MIRPRNVRLLVATAWLGAGCSGQVMPGGTTSTGGTGGVDPTGGSGGHGATGGRGGSGGTGTGTAGQAPLRRLTNFEYSNTIRDLLGPNAGGADPSFVADQISNLSGYTKGASITTGSDARQFLDSADQISTAAMSAVTSLLPCKPIPTATADQDACAKKFITEFGLRAFRRPVTSDEAADLQALYAAQRGPDVAASFPDAMRVVVAGMLQSPYFLYRWELSGAPEKDGTLARFNSYEMASRLSYFLWASMPDQTLFDAAGRNELQTPDQIEAQARRLLKDTRAQDGLHDFVAQWLNIAGVAGFPKDPMLFKDYTPQVGAAMLKETGAFMANLMWGDKATGKLETLLTSSSSFADAGLAALYGVQGVSGSDLKPVSLPATERGGVLTQAAFLASHANAAASHPVKRGVDILARLMCIDLMPPTNREVPPVKEKRPDETTRQQFTEHSSDPFCASCHAIIDPIGFAFENYDAVGAYRTMDNGKMVDATGTVTLDGVDKPFKNGIELSKLMAQSDDVRACMAKQWTRYALRRREVVGEDPSLAQMGTKFKDSGFDLRELMFALTRTQAFTHRALSDGESF